MIEKQVTNHLMTKTSNADTKNENKIQIRKIIEQIQFLFNGISFICPKKKIALFCSDIFVQILSYCFNFQNNFVSNPLPILIEENNG